MSNQTSNLNVTSFNLDSFYTMFGCTWLNDSLLVFVVFPLSAVGCLLNLFSYLILSKGLFNKSSFYTYVKIYVINSFCINLNLTFLFWSNTLRYFVFSNSAASSIYRSYIFVPLLNVNIFLSSLLDIVVSLDRALKFYPESSVKFSTISANKISLALIFSSAVVCSLAFLQYKPMFLQLDSTEQIRIYFIVDTDFSTSSFAKAYKYLVFFLRDLVCLLIQIVLNAAIVILLKRYIAQNKNRGVYDGRTMAKLSNEDQRNTLMAIIMCSFSLIEHFMFFGMVVYMDFNNQGIWSVFLAAITMIVITIRHMSNFFILYSSNRPFYQSVWLAN